MTIARQPVINFRGKIIVKKKGDILPLLFNFRLSVYKAGITFKERGDSERVTV